jgi:hypothetical protein
MTYAILLLNAALMKTMPLLLGRLIAGRRGAGWGLFGIGAATFVASQIGHIPFNWLVVDQGLITVLALAVAALDGVLHYLAVRLFERETILTRWK